MTSDPFNEQLAKLGAPFPAEDIEWRIGRSGKNANGVWAMCLAYITNRAIMERLDEVVGPGNWKNEFTASPAGGVLCGLSIRIGSEWVTKWDGAENTEFEAVKGGLSGAMKRAGVQWSIGRYLYALEEGWATIDQNGSQYAKTKEGDSFHWDPPALPEWALPGGSGKPPVEKRDRKTGEVTERPREATKATAQPSNGTTFSVDGVVGFGKYRHMTWREVLAKDASYVGWAVESPKSTLPAEARAVLVEALEKGVEPLDPIEAEAAFQGALDRP